MRTPQTSPNDRYPLADSTSRAVAEAVALDDDAPAYVWPLNPWGGYPFQRSRS